MFEFERLNSALINATGCLQNISNIPISDRNADADILKTSLYFTTTPTTKGGRRI